MAAYLKIATCRECPHQGSERYLTADSWEHVSQDYCKKTDRPRPPKTDKTPSKEGTSLLCRYEWVSERIDKIPGWCPLRDASKSEVDLYKVLTTESLRTKVVLYIGVKSLTRLYVWIMGLRHAEGFGGAKVFSDPPFGDFHEFIRKKYNLFESTIGWCNMILEVENRIDPERAEIRAVDRFFVDLDEFIGTK